MRDPQRQSVPATAAASRPPLGGVMLLAVLSLMAGAGGAGAVLVTLEASPQRVPNRAVEAVRQSVALAAKALHAADQARTRSMPASLRRLPDVAVEAPPVEGAGVPAVVDRRRADAAAGLLNLPPPGRSII